GGGMLFTSVVSFTRLARRVLDDAGNRTAYLSKQGRLMLLRRVLDESKNDLRLFKRVGQRAGFAAECDEIILKCKRFSITPEELASAEGLPDQLAEKLSDFALVYERLLERMAGRYIDGEDLVNAMIGLLPSSPRVCGAEVFIDAPDMLNEQSLRIIGALLGTAAKVTLTFRIDPDGNSADERLFRPDMASFLRVSELAKAAGCPVNTVRLSGNRRHENAPLAWLERNLFAYPYEKFPTDAKNIELHSSYDRRREADEAAERILRAVRSGLRFRDIAVAVSDLSGYAPIIRRSFASEGIPFFMDAKRRVSSHPIAELITSALRCVQKGFRSEDFIRVLKTELTGLPRESAEKLENHILKFGLEGKRLSSPEPSVKNHDDISNFEELDSARLAVAEPICALGERLSAEGSGKRSADSRVRCVYEYLSDLRVAEKLKADCDRLREEPSTLIYALENQQIYDTIIELLDQITVILGDEQIGLERFTAVVEEGLSAYEVGVIPTTLDQVLVGDISGIHLPSCRLLLVLGANEGQIPRMRSDNSIIDDRELSLMKKAGLNAWESSESMNAAENLNIYSVISKATDELYFSYCHRIGAESSVPSLLIGRIGELFPHAERTGDDHAAANGATDEAAFRDLAAGMRKLIDTGTETPGLPELYAHFAADPAHSAAMEALDSMFFPEISPAPLGQDAALRLYGRFASGSPTRLEIFNRCPYRYLLDYGLRLRERELRQERSLDYGTLIHNALDLLMDGLIEEKADFAALTPEMIEERLDSFLPSLFAEHNGGILLDSGKLRAGMRRIREELIAIAVALVGQIADGSFRPYASELSFGKPVDTVPALELHGESGAVFRITGIVDRVDTLREPEGGGYYRIIDYKTGSVTFDYSELAAGLRLQLPLYAAAVRAALSAAEKYRAAGLYYLHAADLSSLSGDEEKDAHKLRMEMRLNGPTLSDEAVITATDGTNFSTSVVVNGIKFSENDGCYSGKSLVSAEEMEHAIEFAKQVGSHTLDLIMRGNAEVSPCKYGSSSACQYCAYASICRFDTTAGNKYRRIRSVTADQFFDRKE
ncbi:MAG: exodeoxyribonuclease V subunit gamma, partial [Clostridia bacterium]|nr:exodeoxyribonuclease V subunit gamma [Clostridia bacterium]